MLADIVELEKKFNELLPKGQQQERTCALLMETGRQWCNRIWDKATHLGELHFSAAQIAAAVDFSERAVFICGSERSGTTLLRNLLDAHPQLSVLPSEGTYITHHEQKLLQLPVSERCSFLCREWLWRTVLSMHQPPYWLLGRSTMQHSPYIDFARAFITWWHIAEERLASKNMQWPFIALQLAFATTQNKLGSHLQQVYWAEKTPNNEQHTARLLHDFPKAKIVQTVRNPVDVLRSNKPHEALSTVSKYAFIHKLQKSYEAANEQLKKNDSRYLIVRYEDLCANPVLTMQQVASFLDITYINSLLMPTVVGQLTGPNSSFKQQDVAGKIIAAKERVQEDKLTSKDYRLLSASLYGLVEPFGYNLQCIDPLQRQMFKAILFTQRGLNKLTRMV